jgi:hypothetical protein
MFPKFLIQTIMSPLSTLAKRLLLLFPHRTQARRLIDLFATDAGDTATPTVSNEGITSSTQRPAIGLIVPTARLCWPRGSRLAERKGGRETRPR